MRYLLALLLTGCAYQVTDYPQQRARKLFALLLSVATLGGVVQLQGCAGYNWIYDGQVATYYRWIVVERETFPLVCGFIPPDGYNSGGACAIRLQQGIVMPGDKELTGKVYEGERKVGKLCVIQATMSEIEASRMLDKFGEIPLDEHERKHCQGWIHTEAGK